MQSINRDHTTDTSEPGINDRRSDEGPSEILTVQALLCIQQLS